MDIDDIHKNWTELGEKDPMWVVLSHPDKKGGGWTEGEFFENGREEINGVLKKLEEAKIPLSFGKALDFGCGLGRLSNALGNHFSSVDGVDVSASMIEQAKKLNKLPDKVQFHLNVKSDLGAFPSESYDFIYSNICLQHIPTHFQFKYIADFMRLLKGGGIAYFQTIHARGWRKFIPNSAADCIRKIKNRGKAFIPMYGIPFSRVCDTIKTSGGVLKQNQSVAYGGWEARYANDIYIVQKQKIN